MGNLLNIGLLFVIAIGSIIAHEISHGYAAHCLGDDTAKRAGRLSLNPLKHLDPIGSVLVPLLLILSGTGLLFGWAKPVPIHPGNFQDPRADNVKVALAGPFMNMLLAGIAALIFRVVAPVDWLTTVVILNVTLALFNLIPLPPLDGSKLLTLFLPDDLADSFEHINPLATFLILILLVNSGIFADWLGRSVGTLSLFLLGH